ncbi:MAG: hypothetical protein LAT67_07225 [Balneolales bacterium]|nr:hypothetical protein [Balneolales bacterium]
MNQPIQKSVTVLWLLVACCLCTILLLYFLQPPQRTALESLSQVDEIILKTVQPYSLMQGNSSRIQTTDVDSLFNRKTYFFSTERGLPATKIHADLAFLLQPYQIQLYGSRQFPENILHIDMLYSGKLIRTLIFEPVRPGTTQSVPNNTTNR